MHLAQGVAEQALAEQRQVLAAERERVAAVEDLARQDAALARQQSAAAQAAQQVSETRLADLELLLEQRAAQIQDPQQREGLLRERLEAHQAEPDIAAEAAGVAAQGRAGARRAGELRPWGRRSCAP
jgi:hypothetical protein